MGRTPGSWLISDFDHWVIRFTYADETGRVDERQVERLGTKEEVEKKYLELATRLGRAALLKKMALRGSIVEVIGLFRHQGMIEQIRVKGADFERPHHREEE